MVQHDSTQHGGERNRGGSGPSGATGPVRVVVGAHVLTVNPVDGSEIEPCPSGELPGEPRKLTPGERPAQGPAAVPEGGTAGGTHHIPMLERDEERESLARQLARGRSIRLTGPSGSGRSTLLDAVAEDVAGLAPDGVVRLSGYHRTSADLQQELFAAVHDAPRRRPSEEEVRTALHSVGAVVIVDDLEFGGTALDDLLDATPECAFLMAATPDVAPPSADAHVEEVALTGLSRTGCLELLEHAVRRPLTNEETDAAGDLWFSSEDASEGLPLRFVQAGAILRNGSAGELGGTGEGGRSAVVAERLSSSAREALRFALALGGELPHHTQLPALTGDPQADRAVAELAGAGLVTAAGGHYRLAAGVAEELRAAGYADGADARALAAARHYGWWSGHSSAGPGKVRVEADAVLAALHGARRGGNPSAAVLVARTVAPVLAASLRWGAWERALRGGQEAARMSGEVAEEAYFHHELGVLAFCTGQPERAHAELEASIALRGALADQRGTVTGRRALALVTDMMAAGAQAAHAPDPEPSSEAAAGIEPAAVVYEDTRAPVPASLQDNGNGNGNGSGNGNGDGGRGRAGDKPETAPTVAAAAAHAEGGLPPRSGASEGGRAGRRLPHFRGNRGNVAAAGAGVVLITVLGTIMGLGSLPDDGTGPPDSGRPGSSSAQPEEEGGGNAGSPGSGSPESDSSSPKDPSSSKSPEESESGASPSESSSEPDEEPSESGPGDSGGGNGSGSSGGGSDNGGSDSGGSDGGTDDGGASDGGTDSGGSDGGTDDGGASDGGTDSGGSDGGTDDGGTDNGGNDGGTDDGGTSDGGTTDGGTDSGGSASGGSADGGTDTGGSDTGGTSDSGGTGSPSPTGTPAPVA